MVSIEEISRGLASETGLAEVTRIVDTLVRGGHEIDDITEMVREGVFDEIGITRESLIEALNEERVREVEILGDEVLPAYVDSIEQYGGKARKTLGGVKSKEGYLTGINSFGLVHLQNSGILPPRVKRLAERRDLERELKRNEHFFKGMSSIVGLVLKTKTDGGFSLIAKRLWEQLSNRGIEIGNGVLIPYFALRNESSRRSSYGLVLNLKEEVSTQDLGIEPVEDYSWRWGRKDGLSYATLNRHGEWSHVGEVDGSGYWKALVVTEKSIS